VCSLHPSRNRQIRVVLRCRESRHHRSRDQPPRRQPVISAHPSLHSHRPGGPIVGGINGRSGRSRLMNRLLTAPLVHDRSQWLRPESTDSKLAASAQRPCISIGLSAPHQDQGDPDDVAGSVSFSTDARRGTSADHRAALVRAGASAGAPAISGTLPGLPTGSDRAAPCRLGLRGPERNPLGRPNPAGWPAFSPRGHKCTVRPNLHRARIAWGCWGSGALHREARGITGA
jgi:hypothetical protein